MDSACIPKLLYDQDSSDVQLRIETYNRDPGMVVPAHSLVLMTNSKVFRTMLETAHFKEGRTGVVELKVRGDLDDAILFLRYLYTRELEHVDLDVYVSLLQTAHMYDVYDLVKLCNERILAAVNPLTVCSTYDSVKHVASDNLLNHCKDVMLQFAFLIFWKDLHLNLDEETMSSLLVSDKLRLLNEEQALGALWRWGCTRLVLEKESNLGVEQRIAKLLPLIRQPLVEIFVDGSPWNGLWEAVKSDTGNKISTEERLPDTTRKTIRYAEVFCVTKEFHASRQLAAVDVLLKFSVDRDVLLAGFSVQVWLPREDPEALKLILNDEIILANYHTMQMTHTYFKNYRGCREQIYVYDLIIEFKTPVLLRKSEFSLLTINSNHSFSITNYAVSRGNCSSFRHEHDIHFSYTDERTAISKLYCFV